MGVSCRSEILQQFRHQLARSHGEARRAVRGGVSLFSSDRSLSLLSWGERFLPEYFRERPSKMHRWIDEHLDRYASRRGMKLNLLGPRGSAKSTLITLAYVLRSALEGLEPYIWILSDTRQQVRSHLDCIRVQMVSNPELCKVYPESFGRGPVWRDQILRLRNGVVIEAFGSGQRLRGKRSGANRPTLIVCDDLQSEMHIYSADLRESSRNWFTGTVLKAGDERTNLIHIGTALHRECLSIQLTHTPGWRSRAFSSIIRWPDAMSLWKEWESLYSDAERADSAQRALSFYEDHRSQMDVGAELLWPERESLYTLMRMRCEGGASTFEREKQNHPIHPDQCEWSEELFDETIWFNEWPTDLRLKTLTLDPSKGNDSRCGDYSAFVMLGMDTNGILYIDADMKRRPTHQIISEGVELVRSFGPDAFGVESNQFQQLLAELFTEEFGRQGMSTNPWMIENRVNKMIRIRRLSPFLSGRRIRFRRGSPGSQLLVEQLRTFPLGDHDDGPDALEMAIRLATELQCPVSRLDDGLGTRLPL